MSSVLQCRGRVLGTVVGDAFKRAGGLKRGLHSRVDPARREPWSERGHVSKEELARILGIHKPAESMLRLMEVLNQSTQLFRTSPDFAIPEIRFSQIEDGRLPFFVTRQINRRGVVVVRGVVPEITALMWRDSILEYLEKNGRGSCPPGAQPFFWSLAQVQAREHTGVREVLAALNRLWKPDTSAAPVDLTKSLSYCDRFFVGKPSSPSMHKGPVMSGGSASDRLTPHHRQGYQEIYTGRWEEWDPFKAGPRVGAADAAWRQLWVGGGQGLRANYGEDACKEEEGEEGGLGVEVPLPPKLFRPFQGCLSFGSWGEKGHVHVVPMMRVATAFMLLRPFMDDVSQEEGLLGFGDGPEVVLDARWHQPLLDALVRLPPLSPGDAVFWHTDLIHCESGGLSEVKREYAGIHLSALPVCEANSAYVRAQREAFVRGKPPPAYVPGSGRGLDGSTTAGDGDWAPEMGFKGRAVAQDLSRGGERAMGLRSWKKEHHNDALLLHHRLLDLPYGW